MPLKVAVNPDTKETMVLQGESWVKADQVAKNPAGQSAYLIGGNWVQDDAPAAKPPPDPGPPKDEGFIDRFKRLAFSSPESKLAERPDASVEKVAQSGQDAARGAAATAIAPFAALAGGANVMAGAMEGKVSANEVEQRFQEGQQALTYTPGTQGGREAAEGLGTLLGAPGAALHYVGDKIGDVSPLGGAAFETLGNAVLMAAPGLRGRAKAGAPKIPASAGLKEAPMPQFSPEQVARAEQFAAKAGVDWNGAGPKFRENLSKIAADAKALDRLDPKAVARVARAEKIGAPITRGQATRDLVQITDEENIKRTKAGEDIRKKSAQQDTALHDELTRIRQGVAPKAGVPDASDVGTAAQSASRRKEQVIKAEAGRLFREADANGEMLQPVNSEPLNAFLKEPVNKRNIGWLEGAIKDYADKNGMLTLKNMEDLRAEVSAAAGESGRKGFVGGKALRVIDDILDRVDSNVYSQARAKWRAYKEEFSEKSAIRNLTTEKAGTTDRRIALEDTLQRMIRGSNEGLVQIKNSLTRGGTEQTRKRGAQAWQKLQAGVIEHFRDIAAGRRRIEGEDSQLQFNSAFIDEVARMEQGGKLETLFGKKVANEIRNLVDTTRDLRTTPAARVAGSETAVRIMRMLEHVTQLPGIKYVGEKLHERATVKKAASNPLEEAAQKAPVPRGTKKPLSPIKRAGTAAGVLAPQTYQGDQK